MSRRLMVAISGASGAIYAQRLLQTVQSIYDRVYLTASDNAIGIMADELGIDSLQGILPSNIVESGEWRVESPESTSSCPVASQKAHALIPKKATVSGQGCPETTLGVFSIFNSNDLSAPPASGSHDYDGLVVIPCSMGVVGRIAAGVSNDLVTRAADVCLKERRKLILVVRETPLSLVHLRNLTALTEAGAVVLPAAPGFYNKPQTIDDMVDFVVDRVLRALGVDMRLIKGWGEE